MKKFYYKLKECENYNVIILAVLVSLLVVLVRTILVLINNIYQLVMWGMPDIYSVSVLGISIISVIATLMAMAFIVNACKRSPSFMIGAIVALAVATVAGVSYCSLHCLIACIYWCWMVMKKPEGDLMHHVKRLTVILLVVEFVLFMVVELSCWIPYGFDSLYGELYYAVEHLTFNLFNPEILLIAYIFKNSGNRVFKIICRILAVLWIVLALWTLVGPYLSIGTVGSWDEWGSDSVEEGDWSEWETEETLDDEAYDF